MSEAFTHERSVPRDEQYGVGAVREFMEMDLAIAVGKLRMELKNDPELYFAYQANIAMPFVDAYKAALEVQADYHPDVDLYEVANTAAKQFLDLLIGDL